MIMMIHLMVLVEDNDVYICVTESNAFLFVVVNDNDYDDDDDDEVCEDNEL